MALPSVASSQGRTQDSKTTDARQTIELSFAATGKKVFPLVCEYPSTVITDIKLPDLVVRNHLSAPITADSIETIGTANGKKVAAFFINPDRLHRLINQVNPQLKRQLAATSARRDWPAVRMGRIALDASALSDSATIGPEQCSIVLLSQALHFHFAGMDHVDDLEVILRARTTEGLRAAALKIPLGFRKAEVQYVFPVRGSVTIGNMPMNYGFHRLAHSQEFAFDITSEVPDADGQLTSSRKEKSPELTDYYIYRREVLSAADGTVAEVGNAFPEKESVSPADWTQAKNLLTIQRLESRIGFQNAAFGNYIILQHTPGEFSLYAHLSQDSLRVTPGDKVKAGQIIARVGSTGSSSEPHLHFQIMDSRDFLAANGLPVTFADVPLSKWNGSLTAANTILSSDVLHLFLPGIGQRGS